MTEEQRKELRDIARLVKYRIRKAEEKQLSRDNHRPATFGAKERQSAGCHLRQAGENPCKR